MPLNLKLRNDYAELVDSYLNGVSAYGEQLLESASGSAGLVGTPEEIVEALNSLVDPDGEHTVKDELKDGIENLQELLNSPEIYVQDPSNYAEFKAIVIDRIKNKIEELKALTPEEAAKYLKQKEEKSEEAKQSRFVLSTATPPEPGSEAHTISFDQLFAQQQADFSLPWVARDADTIEEASREAAFRESLRATGLSLRGILELPVIGTFTARIAAERRQGRQPQGIAFG